MTSYALEIAAVGSRRQAAAAGRLIEWACQYVRGHAPVNDFDRAWELAALAALEGSIDSDGLRAHLAHLHAPFSDEPRAQLAAGIAEEQFNAPSEALTRSLAAVELARARNRKSFATPARAARPTTGRSCASARRSGIRPFTPRPS